uniref:uncharacterized protein LOC122595393 n=1 Tax=Erigeron canadensis TaxID=72917 RepID=UPI001CB99B39|nr:uncharacterized protein LOC122595393 [Erigeron canadensis]
MEGLHIAIDNLIKGNIFKCANVNQVPVSHLFYADDVMFIGEWKGDNVTVLTKALSYFFCISGLKINLEKSSIIGIGVESNVVNQMATSVGCKAESVPFKYLGIPIGGSPARISTWDPIISKFKKKLSCWKANLLSIGGRSTLISFVLGSLGTYFLSLFRMPKKVNRMLEAFRAMFFWGVRSQNNRKIHWIKWGSVLALKDDGGVGFGSLEAMNYALLYRWRWRALSNPNNLWVRVVAAIHGDGCFVNLSASNGGLWSRIVDMVKLMHDIPTITSKVITRKIGNGMRTKFWHDIWCGDDSLGTRYPRLYALDCDKTCSVYSRWKNGGWSWNWRHEIRSARESEMVQHLTNALPTDLCLRDEDGWMDVES